MFVLVGLHVPTSDAGMAEMFAPVSGNASSVTRWPSGPVSVTWTHSRPSNGGTLFSVVVGDIDIAPTMPSTVLDTPSCVGSCWFPVVCAALFSVADRQTARKCPTLLQPLHVLSLAGHFGSSALWPGYPQR